MPICGVQNHSDLIKPAAVGLATSAAVLIALKALRFSTLQSARAAAGAFPLSTLMAYKLLSPTQAPNQLAPPQLSPVPPSSGPEPQPVPQTPQLTPYQPHHEAIDQIVARLSITSHFDGTKVSWCLNDLGPVLTALGQEDCPVETVTWQDRGPDTSLVWGDLSETRFQDAPADFQRYVSKLTVFYEGLDVDPCTYARHMPHLEVFSANVPKSQMPSSVARSLLLNCPIRRIIDREIRESVHNSIARKIEDSETLGFEEQKYLERQTTFDTSQWKSLGYREPSRELVKSLVEMMPNLNEVDLESCEKELNEGWAPMLSELAARAQITVGWAHIDACGKLGRGEEISDLERALVKSVRTLQYQEEDGSLARILRETPHLKEVQVGGDYDGIDLTDWADDEVNALVNLPAGVKIRLPSSALSNVEEGTPLHRLQQRVSQ